MRTKRRSLRDNFTNLDHRSIVRKVQCLRDSKTRLGLARHAFTTRREHAVLILATIQAKKIGQIETQPLML